jgi:hypothetical protein
MLSDGASSSPGSAALGKSPCARRELGGDPRDFYERVLAFLQAFFQQPEKFSDRLTAVLPPDSQLADRLAFWPNWTTLVCQFWRHIRCIVEYRL